MTYERETEDAEQGTVRKKRKAVKESTDESSSIELELSQIVWPEELAEVVPIELVEWLLVDNLSTVALSAAANRGVHVERRGRGFSLIGGFVPFLLLQQAGWKDKIRCSVEHRVASDLLQSHFQDELYLTVFAIKRGAISNGVMAALFKSLLSYGSATKRPSGICINSEHLHSGANVMKAVAGYDQRAFTRANREEVSGEVLQLVSNILGLSSTKPANDDTPEKNDAGKV